MKPTLSFLNIELNSYHIFMILSIFCFVFVLKLLLLKFKITNLDFWFYISTIFVFGFLGSKLFYVLEDFSVETILNKIINIKDGYVLFGGIVFVFVTTFFYTKYHKLDTFLFFDLISITFSFSIFTGKISCLLAGCCYGIPSNFNNFGITFKHYLSPAYPKNEPLFPIQIIDSLFGLILFCILLWFKLKVRNKNGSVFILFFIIYPFYRFFSEFYRADEIRGFIFNGLFSLSQFYSIIVFILIIVFGLIFYFKKEKEIY